MNKIELLEYIQKYTTQKGYPPTIREIGHHFNTYILTISSICTELKKQGYLLDIPKKARALVLTTKGLNEIRYLEPPEVSIFNDKAYVKLTEYQDLQNRLSKRICELQSELSAEKSRCAQIKKHCDGIRTY